MQLVSKDVALLAKLTSVVNKLAEAAEVGLGRVRRPNERVEDYVLSYIAHLEGQSNDGRRMIVIPSRRGKQFVRVGDILFIRSEDKVLVLQTKDKQFLVEDSIARMEKEFSDFLRVNRNLLVARKYIDRFERARRTTGENRSWWFWQVVVKEWAEPLPVSRREWQNVRNALGMDYAGPAAIIL